MSANPSAGAVARPIAIPVSQTMPWLIGALVLGLVIYYFIGIDEGATSVFGNSMMVHEFVHDGRHFLGFPCH
jgi:cobalt transporter subunit CbtB